MELIDLVYSSRNFN